VMDAAERHREFIAGLAAERAWLQVSKMMRVRWLAAANEAGLSGDKAQVLPIAIAPRRGNREHTLVDAAGPITAAAFGREDFLRASNLRHRGTIIGRFYSFGGSEFRKPQFKRILHQLGISCRQAVLGGECRVRPTGGEINGCDIANLCQ
jgi:hypothetical protein